MNASTRLLAIGAIAALSSLAAHANGEGDNAPEFTKPFVSSVPVAQVRAEALTPVVITNGGTGFIGVTDSALTREQVRMQAIAALREGTISSGEADPM